jgi:cell division protein FtsA
LVFYEIKSSGLEKKLVGGIVITGGGAQLKNITQLSEFVTGLDSRIGYPNEHLAKGLVEEVKSPVYATGVGLVLKGLYDESESGNAIREGHAEVTSEAKEKTEKKSHIFNRFKDWLKDESDIKDF